MSYAPLEAGYYFIKYNAVDRVNYYCECNLIMFLFFYFIFFNSIGVLCISIVETL